MNIMNTSIKKEVALVLSSGGPRGFAYIGAIEELERRGYKITQVAGTSIGSLIGGIYAAGKLPQMKEWLYNLDAWKVFSLMDLSIGKNHILKGDKLIHEMKSIVPEVKIEDMEIPFKAVATDLYTGEEVVFDRGSLYDAIRASISIPSLFRPAKYGYRTLIDGGIADTLPLGKIDRPENGIVVAFNVNDVDVDGIRQTIMNGVRQQEDKARQEEEMKLERRTIMDSIRHNTSLSFLDKMKLAGEHGRRMLENAISSEEETSMEIGENYYDLLSRTFSLMNHINSRQAIQMYPPDVLVSMPFDAYGDISDYARADEIAEAGRVLMKTALDRYEDEHSKF